MTSGRGGGASCGAAWVSFPGGRSICTSATSSRPMASTCSTSSAATGGRPRIHDRSGAAADQLPVEPAQRNRGQLFQPDIPLSPESAPLAGNRRRAAGRAGRDGGLAVHTRTGPARHHRREPPATEHDLRGGGRPAAVRLVRCRRHPDAQPAWTRRTARVAEMRNSSGDRAFSGTAQLQKRLGERRRGDAGVHLYRCAGPGVGQLFPHRLQSRGRGAGWHVERPAALCLRASNPGTRSPSARSRIFRSASGWACSTTATPGTRIPTRWMET